MFGGESSHNLDPKNRLFLPKRIQEQLERNAEGQLECVLTRGFEGCLFLFSEPTFQRVLARLQTQPFVGKEQRKMQRLFFSNTYHLQVDGNGRILLPEKLKKAARLEREVVLLGVADRAEIWSKEAWETFEEEHSDDFDDLDGVLCGDANAPAPVSAPGAPPGASPGAAGAPPAAGTT